jgi:hypothetical protein
MSMNNLNPEFNLQAYPAISTDLHSSALPITAVNSSPYVDRRLLHPRTPVTAIGKYSYQENLPPSPHNMTNFDINYYHHPKITTTTTTTNISNRTTITPSSDDHTAGDFFKEKMHKAFITLLPREKVPYDIGTSSKTPTRTATSKKAINTEGLPEEFLTNQRHDDVLNTGFYSTKK